MNNLTNGNQQTVTDPFKDLLARWGTEVTLPRGLKMCDNCIVANKPYFLGLLVQMVEQGEIAATEVIKFETTGQISSKTQSVLWGRLKIAPPELFEIQDAYRTATTKLSDEVQKTITGLKNEFELFKNSLTSTVESMKKPKQPKKKRNKQ